MTTTPRIQSVDDLLGLVPHLLGHHPADCVVLLPTRRKLLLATSRIPVVDDDSGEPFADEDVSTMSDHAIDTFAAHGADGVYAVVYAPRERALALLDRIAPRAEAAGLRVRDLAVVHDGRRFSPWARDARERVDGIPLVLGELADCVLARVAEGSHPLEDRRAIRALVLPDAELTVGVAAALAARTLPGSGKKAGSVPRCGRCWATVLGAGVRATPIADLTDAQVADLLLSLTDVHWRDALIASIVPGSLPLDALPPGARRAAKRWLRGCDETRLVLDRLLALARRAPDESLVSAPLCALVSCVAWHLGSGSIARDAVERALRIDPGHRLALLLAQVIEHNIRPGLGPSSGRPMALADRPAV